MAIYSQINICKKLILTWHGQGRNLLIQLSAIKERKSNHYAVCLIAVLKQLSNRTDNVDMSKLSLRLYLITQWIMGGIYTAKLLRLSFMFCLTVIVLYFSIHKGFCQSFTY